MNKNENTSHKASLFEQSLEELTCNDLAPKKTAKRNKGQMYSQALWLLLALALFGVFLYTGSLAAKNIYEFFTAQSDYEDLASMFSPVTGKSEMPSILKTGAVTYAIADFDRLMQGDVIYPDDPPSGVEIPSVNPGGESSNSGGNTSTVPEEDDDPYLSEEKFLYFRDQLEGLRASTKNKDIFAWIFIPGTNINYPVLMSSAQNPDYYLNRNERKQKSSAGSIYMDYRNNTNLLNNPFTVFYGHNIRSRGTMFNRLLEFLNKDMFDTYRYIYVYTTEAVLKYEIFSVYEDHGYNSPSINITGLSEEAFMQKINTIKDRSVHQRAGLTLRPSDHVLMLYTCSNEVDAITGTDIRCMAFGVLVGAVTASSI